MSTPQIPPLPPLTPAFVKARTITLRFEKGYANHKEDPGGATLNGVTQATYDAWRKRNGLPTRPVRQMEHDEEVHIYLEYWNECGCDKLEARMGTVAFDTAFNHGVGQMKKWLRRVKTPEEMIQKRRDLYALLIRRRPGMAAFRDGWNNRLRDLTAIIAQ